MAPRDPWKTVGNVLTIVWTVLCIFSFLASGILTSLLS
jgi:hypothetical protein